MGAEALEHEETTEPPGSPNGSQPERTCAVTRATLGPDELIRFVRGPDGQVVPDLAGRLPGRGVWVGCDRATVAQAARKNVFARSLKRPCSVPNGLEDLVGDLLRDRLCGALSLANKAGLVKCGFTKVEIAVEKGEAFALLHAADAAIGGRAKLDGKFKAIHAEIGGKHPAHVVTVLSCEELSLAMGRSHVVHAALAKGGAAHNFIRDAGRLQRYRSNSSGEAAQPPGSVSDTEQA